LFNICNTIVKQRVSLQHQKKIMNTVDFNKCMLDYKFRQTKLFRPNSNNLTVWSESKQETSIILKNSFVGNFGRTGKENNIALINYTKHPDDMCAKWPNEENRGKMMRKIIKNISSLDSPIRLVFDMHHNGYNYNEIAKSFNIPLETVKERVAYAKKVVREAVLGNCTDYQSFRSMTV
jgi:Sigma-70, region 4